MDVSTKTHGHSSGAWSLASLVRHGDSGGTVRASQGHWPCSQVEPRWRGKPSEHKWIWTQMQLVMGSLALAVNDKSQHSSVLVVLRMRDLANDLI